MKKLYSNEIRQLWSDFWKSKQHNMLPAASLIPDSKDKTVLFTTAWMQQLVPYLVWKPHDLWTRLYNLQKCVRTVDIEEVWDNCHLTCFEMMWNWSLWDYFKKESIEWSFEFLTKYLELPIEKLAVTVFEWDDDAPRDEFSADVWKKVWMPEHKISYMWKNDNWWWPAWETWPCWPDTEIFYRVWPHDFPPLESNKKNDDDNWMEIWNNVFMEYYKDENKVFSKLTKQNVDTWMWFERINMVLQSVDTVYETDLFKWLINIIEENFGIVYPWFWKSDIEFSPEEKIIAKRVRIVCDHIRSSCYMIWDWAIPSNEGRWYVLRRIIRRMYYNLLLLSDKNISLDVFIPNLVNWIDDKYGTYRSELRTNKDVIIKTIQDELNQFQNTINKWLKLLDEKLKSQDKVLSWADIFLLYDTYGFPFELTYEIATWEWFQVDTQWYYEQLELAKQKSRQWSKDMFKKSTDWSRYLEWMPQTIFIWYETMSADSIKILKDFEVEWQRVLIFDKSPFYAESGWQTGDKGIAILDNWQQVKIKDVQKYAWVFLHFVE